MISPHGWFAGRKEEHTAEAGQHAQDVRQLVHRLVSQRPAASDRQARQVLRWVSPQSCRKLHSAVCTCRRARSQRQCCTAICPGSSISDADSVHVAASAWCIRTSAKRLRDSLDPRCWPETEAAPGPCWVVPMESYARARRCAFFTESQEAMRELFTVKCSIGGRGLCHGPSATWVST